MATGCFFMETLDLHGIRHHQVDRMVENFVLLNELPVKIITGKSPEMQSLVKTVLKRHDLGWMYENFVNTGAIIILN